MVEDEKSACCLVFTMSNTGLRVEIGKEALVEVCRRSLAAASVETGGVLIGRYSDDGSLATVKEATGAPADSKAGEAFFDRGTKGLRELLKSRWCRLDRTYYLGEWHYHTQNIPYPSEQDRNQMLSISGDRRYRCNDPILLIATPVGDRSIGLAVFLFVNGRDVVRLTREGSEEDCATV